MPALFDWLAAGMLIVSMLLGAFGVYIWARYRR